MGTMTGRALALVATLPLFSLASPVHPWRLQENASATAHLVLRDATGTGVSVTKMAAIGDSYSAGIGAGDRLGNIALQGQGSGEFVSFSLTLTRLHLTLFF